MTLTFFGHSAFQIEANGTTFLVDPFVTGNPLASSVVSPDDLHPDVILLTHAHGDHWGDTLAIAQRTGALVVANYEIVQYLAQHGHANGHSLNTGGGFDFPWGRVTNTFARHSSSFPDGTYGGLAGGFMLELDGKTLYLAGDTDRFSEMAWYGEDYAIDLAFLPIGNNFTMGPAEAVRAAQMLRPAHTIPVHYDTFPPIQQDAAAFVGRMGEAGLAATALKPGGTFSL